MDEAAAALWMLRAQKGQLSNFTRPAPWDAPARGGGRPLEWVGPEDPNAFTQDAQAARRAHDDGYTVFVRAGRAAKAREHLTRPEGGEGDKDLGMRPYRWAGGRGQRRVSTHARARAATGGPGMMRDAAGDFWQRALLTSKGTDRAHVARARRARGLSPGRLERPRGRDPLWLAPRDAGGRPAYAGKPPPPAVLAGIPSHKERPETEQERADCAAELAPAELAALQIAPHTLNFRRVSTAAPAGAALVVTNTLGRALHVALDLSRVPELGGTQQLAQVGRRRLPGGPPCPRLSRSACSSGQHACRFRTRQPRRRPAPRAQVIPAGRAGKFGARAARARAAHDPRGLRGVPRRRPLRAARGAAAARARGLARGLRPATARSPGR